MSAFFNYSKSNICCFNQVSIFEKVSRLFVVLYVFRFCASV